MTNFEWIKSLSLEELVDERILCCYACVYHGDCIDDNTKSCSYGINLWLKSQHEGLTVI